MGGYLNLTGKILLAQMAASLGAKMLGIGEVNGGEALNLDQRTIDTLELAASVNMRGVFDRALDDADVPDNRATRDALWKHYRSL
jgi:hypothetical protein